MLEKTMNYKWVKLLKLGHFENVELKMVSDRVFSVLSENHKTIQIRLTELKLWPLEQTVATMKNHAQNTLSILYAVNLITKRVRK